ncbi:TetR/AcrR family transcriptional regulator [Aquihabitans sp. G128]|uniref:TetR/AcrR family transcriptional regulator n=1 Tax=Aquihabitans sp. G128 TaxID=2849779 RepID=UPI001C216323|nr:TetR/AcrR family transcriptional regulator [Aquihabitans sp. G128]QXC62453.1 TetR/AcrR family transcriptional regulator [Aquihabitans sp. G128]
MDEPTGKRAKARAELTASIKEVAGRHLATDGPSGLSLRAVARELGLASSAVYRYFASRDELLTALIIDAYDSIGEAVETAERAVDRADHLGRWLAASGAVRRWALDDPNRYALVYGTPVPGYQAPVDTIAHATRAVGVLAAIVVDAAAADALDPAAVGTTAPLPPSVEQDLAAAIDLLFPGVAPPVVAQAIVVWSATFGMVSFELFGQYQNVIFDRDAFFAHSATGLGRSLGLRSP